MTWVPLLLADQSPCLRLLVLCNFLKQENSAEIKELKKIRHKDPLVSGLLQLQAEDGSWGKERTTGFTQKGKIQVTAQVLTRLGYLGFGPGYPAVQRGANYLFRVQREDGSWPLAQYSSNEEGNETYQVISLQTSLPLRGLAACGYTEGPEVEKAYEWLLKQRLQDGAWPTGIASGNYGGVAGYRRLAHSRWGCRSNTLGALICLALHPERRHSSEAKQALDLLLACEIKERSHMGFDVARLIGAEESRGFFTYYARFDIAQVLDLCWRIGASLDDSRVAELVNHVKEVEVPFGLWEYRPKPQANRWITFDILRSLSRLTGNADWITTEPRTPFSRYSRRKQRF